MTDDDRRKNFWCHNMSGLGIFVQAQCNDVFFSLAPHIRTGSVEPTSSDICSPALSTQRETSPLSPHQTSPLSPLIASQHCSRASATLAPLLRHPCAALRVAPLLFHYCCCVLLDSK
ncbi:hypothetical protein ACOSQ3_023449 [Xanthoceras sorbifolium]